jgi:glycosyltransferase involved in cell wall biosynthesis
MRKRRILYVCHNHPSIRPGGAEAYALELYEAMRASEEFEPIFVAKGGPSPAAFTRPGTMVTMVNSDPSQYFFFMDTGTYDWFMGTSPNKDIYVKFFDEFLRASQPDLIHFQHTLFFGYDLIRQARNTLPDVPLVYTLHEYIPICHNHGQMVRTFNKELCQESSPRRCHECFPEYSPQAFFMRQRFIQSHFSLVDKFIAPSRFLLERYAQWGIPREKLVFDDYGRLPRPRIEDDGEKRPRNRMGFFGQINPFKGVDVLLKAMKILAGDQARPWAPRQRPEPHGPETSAHLWLHGANLEVQQVSFQNEIKSLLEANQRNVTLVGKYNHADLPKLMAAVDWVIVPSTWWENSPLVIQEAFHHGRPVICSDIGGMAEKVTDGVNGLHFRAGDPASLAQTMRRAMTSPELWEKLHTHAPQVYPMADHVAHLGELYRSLLGRVPARGG